MNVDINNNLLLPGENVQALEWSLTCSFCSIHTHTQGRTGQCRAGINTVLSGPSGDRAILRVSICTKELGEGLEREKRTGMTAFVCVSKTERDS